MPNQFIIKNGLIVDQGGAIITGSSQLSGSFDILGNSTITGSLNVSSGITGSLFGTSSWATSSSIAISASYSTTASYAATASYYFTSSVTSASFASTASYFVTSSVTSASFASTASLALNFITSSVTSASYAATSSWALNFLTSSVTSASYARTASAASDFVVGNNLTASNALINGTITAQTLVVQTITSSVEYSSGSNIFGSKLTDTQQFTGSVSITGSTHYITGIISASNTIYNAQVQPNLALDTRGRILYSNFFATTASLPDPSLYHGMFSHVHNQGAGYYSHGSNGWIRIWDQFNYPGLISGSEVPSYIAGQAIAPLSVSASSWITASAFFGSGSGIVGVISSSYSTTASFVSTASYAQNSDLLDGLHSSVFATTGSNTFIGNQIITGSLFTTGSNTLIGSTTLTGSLLITGSTTQIGSNTLIGNTVLSGSITISGSTNTGSATASVQIYGDIRQTGYHRFDPIITNINNSISASYIYVSGSTNDLYFAQNSTGYTNTTRLRWLEGNLYTGLFNGGLITTQSSTVYQVSSGSGIVVNLNASIGTNPYPTIEYVNWPNLSASIAPLTASYDQQFIAILSNGTIGAQGTPYEDGDYNTKIPIGIVIHQNRSTINAVQTFPSVAYGWKQRSFDFIKAFGPLKISGYTLSPSGSSTGSLVLSGGTAWVDGRNYIVDPNTPSYITEAVGIATSKIYRYRQSGSGWAYDTNAGIGYPTIDPTQYSNNGVLTPVASNDWSIQRVFYFPNSATKALYIYYGNATYPNETAALAGVSTEAFSEAPNTTANAIYVGYILVRNDADFTVPASYTIYGAGLFRGGGSGGAGGGGGATTLASLSDVSITSPTDYQPFAYNSVTTKWENRSTISASLAGNANTATSASYAATASILLGSVVSSSYASTASWALNFITSSVTSASYARTSSWALNFITSSVTSASYATNAATASYVLQAVSASFATTASYILQAVSASFATTASYIKNISKKVITRIPIIAVQGQTTYITNIPSAVDEVGTELRIKEDLSSAASASLSARIEVATGGAVGFLRMQYSTDEITWSNMNASLVSPYVIDLGVSGSQLTTEEVIPSGAKTTGTYLRLVTSNGTGASDSNARFGNVTLNIIYDL